MSYTPTTWKSGDIVTSEKLNKIENGLAEIAESDNSEFVIPIFTWDEEENLTCNMTFNELNSAIQNGKRCLGCFGISEGESMFYVLDYYTDTQYWFKSTFQTTQALICFNEDNTIEEHFNNTKLIVSIHNNSMDINYLTIHTAITNRLDIHISEYISDTDVHIIYHLLGIDSINKDIYLMKYTLDQTPTPSYVIYHATSNDSYPSLKQ